MSLYELDNDKFEEKIYDNGESCLVVFSRKSCHVCQEVIPVLEEMEPKFQGAFGFYHVDVEDQKSLFQRFSLKGVPQILFFKDGEYQGKLSGKVEDDEVEEKISSVMSD